MFAAAPLMVLPAGLYAAVVLLMGAGVETASRLAAPLIRFSTAGGGRWPVSGSDLMIALAVVVMFVEMVKSTGGRRAALFNHASTMTLFVACLVAMLLAPGFATSTFFLITLMILLDVIAGFIITVAPGMGD